MKAKRSFSIDEVLMGKLLELAKKDNRSPSNYMEQVVRKHLEMIKNK